MIFTLPLWLLGACFTLESMRRGFVGGSALSLFIIKEFGLEGGALPTLTFLRSYLAVEEKLIENIPPFLLFLILPFTDYHEASKCYLGIIEELAELQSPQSCPAFWVKGEAE
ncbi:hypothetical protein ES703_98684 [subsurface metagenome]